MVYETFLTENFFSKVTTENQTVNILWGLKFDGMDSVRRFTFSGPDGKGVMYSGTLI